jgi:ribonuclease P protein component
MLKKTNRLAKDQDIKRVFARGRSFFNPHFTLKYLKDESLARFTVVVSSKVAKKANRRNRLKRIIRELVRKNVQKLQSGDFILVLKPLAATADETKVLSGLFELLKKSKLLKHE